MTETFVFEVFDYFIIGISIVVVFISIWKGFINSILSLVMFNRILINQNLIIMSINQISFIY